MSWGCCAWFGQKSGREGIITSENNRLAYHRENKGNPAHVFEHSD